MCCSSWGCKESDTTATELKENLVIATLPNINISVEIAMRGIFS